MRHPHELSAFLSSQPDLISWFGWDMPLGAAPVAAGGPCMYAACPRQHGLGYTVWAGRKKAARFSNERPTFGAAHKSPMILPARRVCVRNAGPRDAKGEGHGAKLPVFLPHLHTRHGFLSRSTLLRDSKGPSSPPSTLLSDMSRCCAGRSADIRARLSPRQVPPSPDLPAAARSRLHRPGGGESGPAQGNFL